MFRFTSNKLFISYTRTYTTKLPLNDLVSYCKRRGFIFQSSNIYGGLTGAFDYGHVGVLLKNNIRDKWWKDFVLHRGDCVGVDTSIILHPEVWKQSGHLENFSDPLVECKKCKRKFRADHLVQSTIESIEELNKILQENPPECPCGKREKQWGEVRKFNMLFETNYGPAANEKVYLRPETAQGIFINFANIIHTSRKRIPLGIGQVGKSFRNEISPRDFLFRMREFEQMELEYFCHPNDATKFFDEWVKFCYEWLIKYGLKAENIRFNVYKKEELAHYASQTTDIEYNYPFGWAEMWGIANRGDYDLNSHSGAKRELFYVDPVTNEKYIPHVIEPAVGLDRLFLAFIYDAYHVEPVNNDTRVVLKIHPELAPFKFAVFPLMKKPDLLNKAKDVFGELCKQVSCDFDFVGSIGAMYRRHDEVGTPFAVTIDYTTLQDDTVTLRHRDTMQQKRIPISELIQNHQKILNQFTDF